MKNQTLSKAEYWKKWELTELLNDLYLAQKLLENRDDLFCPGGFVEDFKEAFSEELDDLEHWNGSPIYDSIYDWFTPKGKWILLIGEKEGEEVRNRIFNRIKIWRDVTGYKA
ncbi:hypothetical protein [Adhaeribacter pallidiroseus]|uniref:Uncharacterized protein n=1 Tax=Adhaeribacter pallidiroseus TaxID=2072847 RepID=A0A369QL14_9BACT|nr:hypothetical protein [Adhaeribacter pallidiroseus]RDC65414.1 hypothetical protein AHMF7616_04044 [Adhaeribacter pallidiroseus]